MQWFSDLIKHITISKALTFAAMVATGAIVFGPNYLPQIEPAPREWRWAVIGIFIFASTLFLWWVIESVHVNGKTAWRIARRWQLVMLNHPRISKLTKDEEFLLLLLGDAANEHLNLGLLTDRRLFRSKLDLLATSRKLQDRGLIRERYRNDENCVCLTQRGRNFVLKMKEWGEVCEKSGR